jgi:Leucine-rich repeat (LRR) protein
LAPLSSLKKIRELQLPICRKLSDLGPLTNLTQLTSLNLSYCTELSDLGPLANLIQLTSLNLSRCKKISDLSPLNSLTKLISLDFAGCEQISDIGPLASLTQLTSLNINRCKKIIYLGPLNSLTKLISLDFAGCEQISDIGPLASLTQLTSLKLSFCAELSDLGHLASLTQLTSLKLSFCAELSDLGHLARLTQLTSLGLSYCEKLSDLGPLASLTQLTSLDLSHCEKLSDLGPLASLTQLTSLNINHCDKISDLGHLASLTQLTSLDLSYCEKLSDLGPLASLTQLTSLNINHCEKINDIGPLANLTQLTWLDLSGCEISELGPLASLNQLTSLDLSYCEKISDLGPLTSLAQLISLNLARCKKLSELGPLASLNQLTSLNVSSCEFIAIVASLAVLPSLANLCLTGCGNVRDAEKLGDSVALCDFEYDETATRDIVLLACTVRRGDADLADRTATAAASFELSKNPDLHALHLISAVEALSVRAGGNAEVFSAVAAAFRARSEVPLRTWEALLAAIVRTPDPGLRPAFEIALEDLPSSEIERVLGPALIALADAPPSARGWALDLVQRALVPVMASASHARQVAPATAVFFHSQGRTADVDVWLERGSVAQVPAWRDRVLVALLSRALRMDEVLEARRLLGLVQTPERRDEARGMLVQHLAEKAEFRDAAAELDAIVDRARRASVAAQALERTAAFASESHAGLSLLLALDGDPDTLADVLTAMVQQAPDSELVRQLAVVFAPTAGVDLGEAVDALLAHESVIKRTKSKPLAGLRSQVRADRRLVYEALVHGTAALLATKGLVDSDEAAEVTAALLGESA